MQRRRSSRMGQLARSVAALAGAVVLLVALFRGGARYVYCPAMQAVMDAPCCGADDEDRADHADETASVRSPDCCERHVQSHVPAAASPASKLLVDAPLLSALPPVAEVHRERRDAAPLRVAHYERAGPRPAAQRRAELMVFLN